jgi:hypothetical protein
MRVIIAGSRTITDASLIEKAVIASGFEVTELVWGGAAGVDTLAYGWAHERGIPDKSFPADWKRHGKAAGPSRNCEMAAYAEALIAIWDGKSPGTQHMFAEAKRRGLQVFMMRAAR